MARLLTFRNFVTLPVDCFAVVSRPTRRVPIRGRRNAGRRTVGVGRRGRVRGRGLVVPTVRVIRPRPGMTLQSHSPGGPYLCPPVLSPVAQAVANLLLMRGKLWFITWDVRWSAVRPPFPMHMV